MIKNSRFFSTSLVNLLFLAAFISTEIQAIPAFARKYKISCSTCHEAFPKRNSFGESFRRNGYIMPFNNDKLIQKESVKLGAETWKKVWPDAIWPGLLPKDFPAAAYTIMRTTYRPEGNPEIAEFEFTMPLILNFVFGGTFGEDVSFFGRWSAYAAGRNAAGLGRLFFRFNSIVGPESLFNIKIGRFEPAITDGYTSNQRMTLAAAITSDYDPANGWKPRDEQSGIELNGIYNHRFYYALGVVNGESVTIRDPTDQKDVYARLAYQFRGDGFDGRAGEEDSNYFSASNTELAAGIYSYFGSRNRIPIDEQLYNTVFRRYGLDVNYLIDNFNLRSGLIFGEDDNFLNESSILKSRAYFIEGSYGFYPWLIGVLRFEKGDAWREGEDIDNFINIIPNITILYRANIRFTIEAGISLEGDKSIEGITFAGDNAKPIKSLILNAMIAL